MIFGWGCRTGGWVARLALGDPKKWDTIKKDTGSFKGTITCCLNRLFEQWLIQPRLSRPPVQTSGKRTCPSHPSQAPTPPGHQGRQLGGATGWPPGGGSLCSSESDGQIERCHETYQGPGLRKIVSKTSTWRGSMLVDGRVASFWLSGCSFLWFPRAISSNPNAKTGCSKGPQHPWANDPRS